MLAERIRKLLGAQEGFTLIEMMAVIVIIAVLIGMGFKVFSGYIGNAKVKNAIAELERMQSGLELFYAQWGYYPTGTDSMDLAMAGINPDIVATSSAPSVPYEYKNTDTDSSSYQTYELSTSIKVDGNSFVIATGDSGIPYDPVATTNNGF